MNGSYISPSAKPVYIMLKPIGSACNLVCEYCHYLKKSKFYPDVRNHIMTDQVLEKFTKEYMECQTMQGVLFTWHGGEMLTRPISFYKKALELQRKYVGGQQIDNCIQTNGTLLNDEWCRFFEENSFPVGVSIDGPQKFHDEYRKNRQGLPSFYKAMKGIELLKKHGVGYNAMAVMNDYNVDYSLEFYNFFEELDCRFIQFAPIVERIGRYKKGTKLSSLEGQDAAIELAPFSIDSEKWGNFLCALFDKWLKEDVGKFYIQLFDSTLANWVGEQPGVCSLAHHYGHAGVMEFNGSVYICGHFIFPEYKLGNIQTKTLTEMMYSPIQQKFGTDKEDKPPTQCKECEYLFACHGECPRNRFLHTPNGEPGLNYLCKGYKKFSKHVAPYMDFMEKELLSQHPPADVMDWVKQQQHKH